MKAVISIKPFDRDGVTLNLGWTVMHGSTIENFHIPLRDTSDQYIAKLNPLMRVALRMIANFDGIRDIWVHPYEVSVIRTSDVFPFEEWVPKVIKHVKRTCPSELGEVEVIGLEEFLNRGKITVTPQPETPVPAPAKRRFRWPWQSATA